MSEEILKQKLETIQVLVGECLRELGDPEKAQMRTASTTTEVKTPFTQNLALKIANKVSDCDENEGIQKNILDKRDMEGKILLCFYISYKYFENIWLTTGHIAKITSELSVKIDIRNVTNKLKELRQYLESGTTRKKGQPTPYRLNRKGIKRFEQIINAKED